MDWRSVAVGVAASACYLLVLVFVPGAETVRLGGIPLVLATGPSRGDRRLGRYRGLRALRRGACPRREGGLIDPDRSR